MALLQLAARLQATEGSALLQRTINPIIARLWHARSRSMATGEALPKLKEAAADAKKRTQPQATRRAMLWATGLTTAVYAPLAYYMWPHSTPYQVTVQGLRMAKCLWTGLTISLDYYWSLHWEDEKLPRYREIRQEVHKRSAARLYQLCNTQGGVFTKASQFIASMAPLAPAEYVAELSKLQDRAPPKSLSEIRRMFLKDVGKAPEQIFAHFGEEPIGAASLAQVHYAILQTGEEVAVKVQYPSVEYVYKSDIKAIELVFRSIKWMYNVDFTWAAAEFEKNISMELDFVHEARNAEQCARNFRHRRDVVIPRIVWPLTSTRILTMEFMHGHKINDIDAIRRAKLNPAEVSQKLIEAFSEMIFIHGFIHADPHPGNVLVRRGPRGKPELILLDHGLYRELSESFRLSFCKFWRALVMQDMDAVVRYGREVGAGDKGELLASMFSGMRGGGGQRRMVMMQRFTRQEVNASIDNLRKRYKNFSEFLAEFAQFLGDVDRQLMLLMKTVHLIRSVNYDLGASVNRFLVMSRYAIIGARKGEKPVWRMKLGLWKDQFYFTAWWTAIWTWFSASMALNNLLVWMGVRSPTEYWRHQLEG